MALLTLLRSAAARSVLALGAIALAPGCGNNPALTYAPRSPKPEPPPKSVEQVKLLETGKPQCEYEVIGTAFGGSLDELRETAAAHGGDGVYATSCLFMASGGIVGAARVACDGRVFVCK